MDGVSFVPEDLLEPPPPPPRLYERLRQIAGYTWDESHTPFHSTYDFWYASLPEFAHQLAPSLLTRRAFLQ